IDEIRSNDWITPDSDRGGLPNTTGSELIYGFISQGPGSRNNPNRPLFVNARWHDSDLAMPWRNDPRAVRANQPRSPLLQKFPGAHHIESRNTFRDADDQLNLCVRRLHDGIGRERWRHKNHAGVSRGFIHSLLHRVEDGPPLMASSTFAGSHTTHNLCSVFGTCFCVKS